MAPDGRRIPAAEIERLVADRVCRFLSNGAEIFAAMAGGGSTILIRSPFDAFGYPYLRTWSSLPSLWRAQGREGLLWRLKARRRELVDNLAVGFGDRRSRLDAAVFSPHMGRAREQIGDLAAPSTDEVQSAGSQRDTHADGNPIRGFFRQPKKEPLAALLAEGRRLLGGIPEILVLLAQRHVLLDNGGDNLVQRGDLVVLRSEFVLQGVDRGTEGIDYGLVVGILEIQVAGQVEEGGDAVDHENAARFYRYHSI